MDRERWNRLRGRMVRVLRTWDRRDRFRSLTLKLRWLNWAERVTGKTCFFVAW